MQDIYLNKTDAEKMWLDSKLYGCYCKTKDDKWIDVTKVRVNKDTGVLNYLTNDGFIIIEGILTTQI